jgi:hypothetical protein
MNSGETRRAEPDVGVGPRRRRLRSTSYAADRASTSLAAGIRAHITLPEDLTEKEAMRVARFVQSLAFSSDQPAITAGEASVE